MISSHSRVDIWKESYEEYDEKVLSEYDEKLGREIGYVLSKDYWGMGLMPEAVDQD